MNPSHDASMKTQPRPEEPKTEVNLGKDSRLHEQAVMKVAAGKITPIKGRRPRRTAKKAPAKDHKLTQVKVLPQVWSDAMERADNDRFRLQVIDHSTVVVWNNADWKKWGIKVQ